MERKVQAICVQLSDLTSERNFLKEQLQGEHSEKGNQLSHLEGRLLELEKMLKESRISESSLQSQVATVDIILLYYFIYLVIALSFKLRSVFFFSASY